MYIHQTHKCFDEIRPQTFSNIVDVVATTKSILNIDSVRNCTVDLLRSRAQLLKPYLEQISICKDKLRQVDFFVFTCKNHTRHLQKELDHAKKVNKMPYWGRKK